MFAIPLLPLILTLAGLLPFLAGAAAIFGYSDDLARQASVKLVLLLYAASILSFLGGVRWGAEMVRAPASPSAVWMSASVLGSLAGWALASHGALGGLYPWQFLAFAALFIAHWLFDIRTGGALPDWYTPLRTIATLGAVASLTAAWAAGSPF